MPGSRLVFLADMFGGSNDLHVLSVYLSDYLGWLSGNRASMTLVPLSSTACSS
jgi:hypothetical protein